MSHVLDLSNFLKHLKVRSFVLLVRIFEYKLLAFVPPLPQLIKNKYECYYCCYTKVVRAKERIEFELDQKIFPDLITEAEDKSNDTKSNNNNNKDT